MSALVYGLLLRAPDQEPLVKKHCFGDCGRISVGETRSTPLGPLMVCHHQTCPHLGQETTQPIFIARVTGEPIYLRVLRGDE